MELKENNVYCIDAKDGFKLIKSSSVDLILTDPPYTHKDVFTYKYIADFSYKVLKKSGYLLFDVGRGSFLPQIFPLFHDSQLIFKKVLCSFFNKNRFSLYGLKSSFLLHLLYCKDYSYLFDCEDVYSVLGFNSLKKINHKWEKDIDMYKYYIKCFTNEGDLVLDPFCGSGAVLVACKNLNRRFIGFDINKNFVESVKLRLSQGL